jgi:hypothetical protein
MAHAQKNHISSLQTNGRVHLNRHWASVHLTAGSRGVYISGSNVGYTMFRGSVKGTGCQLHSTVSCSLPFLCVTVYHLISTLVYCSLVILVLHTQSVLIQTVKMQHSLRKQICSLQQVPLAASAPVVHCHLLLQLLAVISLRF